MLQERRQDAENCLIGDLERHLSQAKESYMYSTSETEKEEAAQ